MYMCTYYVYATTCQSSWRCMFTYLLTNNKGWTAHVPFYSNYFHKNDRTRTDGNHLPKDHRPFRWLPGVGALQTDRRRI